MESIQFQKGVSIMLGATRTLENKDKYALEAACSKSHFYLALKSLCASGLLLSANWRLPVRTVFHPSTPNTIQLCSASNNQRTELFVYDHVGQPDTLQEYVFVLSESRLRTVVCKVLTGQFLHCTKLALSCLNLGSRQT